MQVYARTEFPRLIFGTWVIEVFHSQSKPNQQIQRSEVTGKLVAEHHTPHEKPKSDQARQSGSEQRWSRLVKREIFSIWCYVICRWLSKVEVPQWGTFSRTHRVALYWLFDRISLDAKIQIHFIDSKHQQIADIVTKGNFTVMSGTISSFVEHLPFHFSLLQRRRQDCGISKTQQRWTWLQLSRQVPPPWTIRLRRKARRYSNHLQGNLTRGQEEIQNPTQRRVLKEGWKMHTLAGWWLE